MQKGMQVGMGQLTANEFTEALFEAQREPPAFAMPAFALSLQYFYQILRKDRLKVYYREIVYLSDLIVLDLLFRLLLWGSPTVPFILFILMVPSAVKKINIFLM